MSSFSESSLFFALLLDKLLTISTAEFVSAKTMDTSVQKVTTGVI